MAAWSHSRHSFLQSSCIRNTTLLFSAGCAPRLPGPLVAPLELLAARHCATPAFDGTATDLSVCSLASAAAPAQASSLVMPKEGVSQLSATRKLCRLPSWLGHDTYQAVSKLVLECHELGEAHVPSAVILASHKTPIDVDGAQLRLSLTSKQACQCTRLPINCQI